MEPEGRRTAAPARRNGGPMPHTWAGNPVAGQKGYFLMNFRAAEFMQYRSPVGGGPSSKT